MGIDCTDLEATYRGLVRLATIRLASVCADPGWSELSISAGGRCYKPLKLLYTKICVL
jgi:hypothetical protein